MSSKSISLSRVTFILLILLIIAFSSFALAANDPGHDTLYVEEQGDSEVNGSLNITGNVSIEGVLYSGANLDVRGDSVQESGDNQLIGTSSGLSIQSVGDLYINTFQGTASTVYLGDGGGDSVNINVSGALFFGSSGRLAASSGSLASSDLYWGDKLVCDASETNCGWATGVAAGDITSVQSDNTYIYNGSDTGAVYLLFNETKLNATIEAKATALGGDGNNYTTGIVVTGTTTKNITLTRNSAVNISATFTDADTTYSNGTGLGLSGQTFSLSAGVMTAGSYGNGTAVPVCTFDTYGRATSCTNTSISFPAATNDGWWPLTNSQYLMNVSNVLYVNDTRLNQTINAIGNLYYNETLYAASLGNYSADRTGIQANITNVNSTANTKAIPANCSPGQFVNGTSTSGVSCATPTSTSDGNNYTYAIGFNTTGTTVQLTLNRTNMANLTANFSLIGNCSVDQSCLNILYDSNASNFINTTTGANYINTSTYATTAITAGTYGNSTAVASCTFDAYGRATSCSNVTISVASGVTSITFNTSGLLGGTISSSGTVALNDTYITYLASIFNETLYAASLGNYSADAAGLKANITNVNSTANTKAVGGYCNGSAVVQNVTTTGVKCITPTGTTYLNTTPILLTGNTFSLATTAITAGTYGNSTAVASCTFDAYGRATTCTNTSISFPAATNDGTGGWTNNTQNTSTTLNVGIGDTTPDALLDVQSTSATNQLRVSYDDTNFGNISINSGGNMTIKATGHVIIDLS